MFVMCRVFRSLQGVGKRRIDSVSSPFVCGKMLVFPLVVSCTCSPWNVSTFAVNIVASLRIVTESSVGRVRKAYDIYSLLNFSI